MSEPTDLVVVEPDGSVRVPGRGADRRLRDRAGRYRLVTDSHGLLILRGEDAEEGEPTGARVLMAGEVVSRMTILEIINIIATAGWRGELHVFGPDSHRTLAIDSASVKYGRSDHPDDRLGQVLYGNGIIGKAELDSVLRQVTPERRFGTIVLEKGILTQDQLFQQLQKQIEQIFYSSLLTPSGAYAFILPDEGAEPPVATVHLPVQALLMEGVQRIDEMALFRSRIPSSDLVPEVVPRSSASQLDEKAQTVLAYSDGNRTIEDIGRETGLGEFQTTKALYGLLQQGLVQLRAPKTIDVEQVRRLVEQFNAVLRDVFMAVAAYGGVSQTKVTLEAWIQGSGYAPIFGDFVEEDGAVTIQHVVDAMLAVQVEAPMEGLLQALHELAAFALFAATTSLPRDQELHLSRDVNLRLKKIRL